jgi:hypothetical protein
MSGPVQDLDEIAFAGSSAISVSSVVSFVTEPLNTPNKKKDRYETIDVK